MQSVENKIEKSRKKKVTQKRKNYYPYPYPYPTLYRGIVDP